MKETKQFITDLINQIKAHILNAGENNEELNELKAKQQRYITSAKTLANVEIENVKNIDVICSALLNSVADDAEKSMIQGFVMFIRQINDQIKSMLNDDSDLKKLRIVLKLLESDEITIVDGLKPKVEPNQPIPSVEPKKEPEVETSTDKVAKVSTAKKPMKLTSIYRAIDFIPGIDPEKYAIMKNGTVIERYRRKTISATRYSCGAKICLDRREFKVIDLLIKAYPDIYDETGKIITDEETPKPEPEAPKPYVERHLPTSVDADRAHDSDEEKLPQEPLPIPYGYKAIVIEGIDPVRYCINRDGLVIDRLDLLNIEPIVSNGKIVIPLKNKNGGFSTYFKQKLIDAAFKNTAAEEIPEDLPIPLILPNTNIPEDRYTIKKDGTIYDTYNKRRLVPETDKRGVIRVTLQGTIKPGNKNSTLYRFDVAELIKQMFPSFNRNADGRIDLERVTKPVEIDTKKHEDEPVPKKAEPVPEKKTESAVVTGPEFRMIDFIEGIPHDKYKINTDGVVYNCYSNKPLVHDTGSCTHRPTVKLSNFGSKETTKRFQKTFCVDKLVWAVFVDQQYLTQHGRPDHADGRLANCRLQNLIVDGRRHRTPPQAPVNPTNA